MSQVISAAALPLAFALAQVSSFEMSLVGVPVGWVRVEESASRLDYQSEHVFRRARAQTRVSYTLDAQGRAENESIPSAKWVLRRPPKGCVGVFDEVTGEKGEGCAEAPAGSASTGTLLREPFAAQYDVDGRLQRLTLGATQFRRVEKLPAFNPARAEVFSQGFPIDGEAGALQLFPLVPGVRTSARAVLAAAEAPTASGACLALAQAAMRRSPGKWRLVLGLVADEGRAWPHAWLKDIATGAEVDLSAYADAPGTRAAAQDYLEFPAAQAGRLYLALLEGKQRVVRAQRQKPPPHR